MKRLINLDYLRGLMAFGIMVFHYSGWMLGYDNPGSLLGRIGVYGVSTFYILSGLTLFYAYKDKMPINKHNIIRFYKNRFLRIYPLLIIVIVTNIFILKTFAFDAVKFILNVTGLFGIFKWNDAYAVGAWSIGNELVFYLFIPVFFFLYKKPLAGLSALSLIIFGIYLYFSFVIINSSIPPSTLWVNYTNPLNQIFLFLAGFLIGAALNDIKISAIKVGAMFIIGIGLFSLIPISNYTSLITGSNRLLMTLACILITVSFFKFGPLLPKVIDKPLSLLGRISYSVYLLHPLVYRVASYFFKPNGGLFVTCILFTIGVSYIVYQKFELYFIKLGKYKAPKLEPGI